MTLEDRVFSATYLNPSHYHDEMRSPAHLSLVRALVERQGELERLLSVKTAQVRLSVRVVSALPPIMVGTLSLISPDFQRGVMTPVGLGCILVAAVLDAVAIVSIRALMRGIV